MKVPLLPWRRIVTPVKSLVLVITLIGFGALPDCVFADAYRDANRLLKLTNIRDQFNSARQEQTHRIIRTYSSIVSTESEYELPQAVKIEIYRCYEENYHWSNFETGIIDILINNFSEKELALLVGFFQNRGLPPSEIDTFRDIVAKGGLIQTLSADYIFKMTDGCVEQGTEAVLNYLRTQP